MTRTNGIGSTTKPREVWVDYLRSAITVLVVVHHAMLAYTSFASFDPVAYIRSTHPVVDEQRWQGFDVLVDFNDIYFMSLMFLIGGLFVSDSIKRKGSLAFLKDRLFRLLIPFITIGTFLMLIAYFPAWLSAHHNTDIIAYIKDFFLVEQWPVGPPWFIWVLFLFNLIAALSTSLLSKQIRKFHNGMAAILVSAREKPLYLFAIVFAIGWLLYVPVAYVVGAGTWAGFGPFDFQLSRILLYLGYFQVGAWMGRAKFNETIFKPGGSLVKYWWIWAVLAIVVFSCLTLSNQQQTLKNLVSNKTISPSIAWIIYYSIYILSCTLSCFAMLTAFRKFAVNERQVWRSLSANAYLVYLLHFVFVTWSQYLMLELQLPVLIKFLICFLVSTLLSWMLAALLRRIEIVRRYL